MIARPSSTDGRDRLFHQHMHAALDAGERQFVMKMGGRRDRHGIDALSEQRRQRR